MLAARSLAELEAPVARWRVLPRPDVVEVLEVVQKAHALRDVIPTVQRLASRAHHQRIGRDVVPIRTEKQDHCVPVLGRRAERIAAALRTVLRVDGGVQLKDGAPWVESRDGMAKLRMASHHSTILPISATETPRVPV